MGDDDRNTWLDRRTAERLLDGEPLDAGPALPPADRDTAERLAALLETAARAGRPAPDTELPGERAALAAFRAARAAESAQSAESAESAESAGSARNGHAVNGRALNGRALNGSRPGGENRLPPRQAPAEPVVRLAPGTAGAAPVRRTPRRLHRLRTAAAVTAAGCVLGGVALAAGTVLRSAPAGPESPPGPATTPPATAGPDRRGDDTDEGTASAGGSRADRPEGRRDAPGTAGAETGGQADGAGDPAGRPGDGAAPGGSGPGDGPGDGPGAKAKSADRLCEKSLAVRDGESKGGDRKSWNRLVRAAGGADAIADYCGKRGGPGGGPGGDHGDDHGGGDHDGGDRDEGGGGDEYD
jgi:hypothetical protein